MDAPRRTVCLRAFNLGWDALAYSALLVAFALAGQPYDPMGLVTEPPSATAGATPRSPAGRPAPLPANESPRGRAAQLRARTGPAPGTVASPEGERLLAEAPSAALGDPMASKYLACASVYAVNHEIGELMNQVHPKDAPDTAYRLELHRRAGEARDALFRRGREILPVSRRATYDRLKPLTVKWASKFTRNATAAFIPRQMGCWGLPEVAAQFPSSE